ncbi:hypothetical protein [Brevundimonas sp.]|jgi:hypothetical protein|uniref:hypothetical protein n=1 Tax=Brevundimonas sp. TaxID=1871086 RepID=UPI0037851E5C
MPKPDSQSESPVDGPEERAASLLNGVMVMALALCLAAFALWALADFTMPIFMGRSPWTWSWDTAHRLLFPIVVLPTAFSMLRWGHRMFRTRISVG